MKKHLLSFAVMLSATLFTACINTDNTPNRYIVPVANGVYVIESGNVDKGIPGSLTSYSYSSKTTTNGINGASLGNGVLNDVMRYGNRTYIVADDENSVFVIDAKTLTMKHRINMINLLGDQGAHPRRITANGENIYVSTYGGCVAVIDTVNFSLVKKYEVGSCPESVLISNGYLYVANSDYGLGNASISIINLATDESKEITNENIRNPQELAIAGTDIYYLDWGQYGPEPDYAQEHAGVYCYSMSEDKAAQIIPDATGMACYGTSIITYNNANGVEKTTYSIYDIRTPSIIKTFEPEGIESPAAIAIDPLTNYLFIASNHKQDGEQYGDYNSNGYVVFYDLTSMGRLGSFNCGIGPVRIAFNNSIEEVEF